jgi:hypothetical protein
LVDLIEVFAVEATIFHSYFHGLHPTCRARVLKLTMTRRGGLDQKENHPWQNIKATFPVNKKRFALTFWKQKLCEISHRSYINECLALNIGNSLLKILIRPSGLMLSSYVTNLLK